MEFIGRCAKILFIRHKTADVSFLGRTSANIL